MQFNAWNVIGLLVDLIAFNVVYLAIILLFGSYLSVLFGTMTAYVVLVGLIMITSLPSKISKLYNLTTLYVKTKLYNGWVFVKSLFSKQVPAPI